MVLLSRNEINAAIGHDLHASALAMELLVILASRPKLGKQLKDAGAVPVAAAWLADGRGDEFADGDAGTRTSLMQGALTALASLLKESDEEEGRSGSFAHRDSRGMPASRLALVGDA